MIDPKGLQEAICSGSRLVIFLHDNPDPDAIACGWLLQKIGESQGRRAMVVYGGNLGRAENRTMVKLLDIPLHPLSPSRPRFTDTDCYALVDTQPLVGNNSFPDKLRAHIVIDHHPLQATLDADFIDVREDYGCCTTLMLDYHQAFNLDLSPAQATAAYYAIISETQDLEREASKADRDACQKLFPLVQLPLLGKIRHPPHDRDYFRTIARAMRQVLVGKNTCICHIGQVHNPEMVAEVADFLVAMRQVSWCLVSGFQDGEMTLSIRTKHEKGQANLVMKNVVDQLGRGGGHDTMAGGAISCTSLEHYQELKHQITPRFLQQLPRRTPERLHPLLDEETPTTIDVPDSSVVKKLQMD